MKNLNDDTVSEYNSSSNVIISVDATSVNTASKIVARDASGNFSAGTITANLTGSASLNVAKAGDTMTNFLTLHANPAQPLHAATKQYVDNAVAANITRVEALVIFDGSNGTIIESVNVNSVTRIDTGVYRITMPSGVFEDGNYVVAGTAGEDDHFINWRSATATELVIATIDNAGVNNAADTTTDTVSVMMVR
jgi:hypothetical protein